MPLLHFLEKKFLLNEKSVSINEKSEFHFKPFVKKRHKINSFVYLGFEFACDQLSLIIKNYA
jgi:hypothetical protein